MPRHDGACACSKSTAQQTVTSAVGPELGSDDGLDGTIGFDGKRSCASADRRDRFATYSIARPDVPHRPLDARRLVPAHDGGARSVRSADAPFGR